jgi:hypothetical protein
MLMNLGLINGHRPEAVHGRMKEKEHLARYSSFEVKGMLFQSCNETLLIIIIIAVQLLGTPGTITGWHYSCQDC